MNLREVQKAAEIIRKAKYAVAFTGAGISADSGIPTFRGENGVWNSHHPVLEADQSLPVIAGRYTGHISCFPSPRTPKVYLSVFFH